MVLVLHTSSDDALYFNSFHENTFKCFIIMIFYEANKICDR